MRCSCGARTQVFCLDTNRPICRQCCELFREGCRYHFFCWVAIV